MDENLANYLLSELQKKYNLIAEKLAQQREKPWPEAYFLVEKYAKNDEKILDLGCGAGQWYEFFKEKNVEYFGVDFSESLINIAKKRYPKANFFVANALSLPFPDEFFDKVYAIALFHHLPSKKIREKVIEQVRRVLKKDGYFILTVWNLWKKKGIKLKIIKFALLKILGKSKLDFGDIFLDWKGVKDFYFHCFSKKEIFNLLKGAFFDIIEIGEFQVKKDSNLYFVCKKSL